MKRDIEYLSLGDLEIGISYRVGNVSIGQTHTSEFLGVSPYNGDVYKFKMFGSVKR